MSGIRVRRHTDGRVALRIQDDGYYRWSSWKPNDRYTEHRLLTDEDVSGEGSVELLVTELPEPDAVPSANTKIWTIEDDWLAVEHGDLMCSGLARDPDRTRSEALKMLAAVATCERYRKDVAQ